MFVAGIASSVLSAITAPQSGVSSKFQTLQSEFKQLGQDLQSGNLGEAQSDFATFTQNLPNNNPFTGTANATSGSPLSQAFSHLAQDLQSGNLQGAQQDFSSLQQGLEQSVSQSIGRHHHHHAGNPQDSSGSQQGNTIGQDFSQLAQTLQAGNLQGAQNAYSTLQNDLQQIGGFSNSGTNSGGYTPPVYSAPLLPGALNVTA